MKSGWKRLPIAGLVTHVETWDPARIQPDGQFTYIDLSAVDQDTKSVVDAKQMPCAEAPSRARQRLTSGDILVSTVRPNLNGVAQVPDSLNGATGSTGFCVLRACTKSLEARYLFQWVKSPGFIGEMVKRATGQSYPAVSDRIVGESLIPLPPLPEQRRLADILDRAEALRAKRRAALAMLDTLTQAIFLDMFGDSSLHSTVLSDHAEVVSGIAKGRKLGGRTTVEVPYLRVANVQDGYLNLDVIKTIEALPAEVSELRLLPGDVVMTEGGDHDKLGRGATWEGQVENCIHQNHVFRVRVDRRHLIPEFFRDYLQTSAARRYFLRCAKKTTNLASINMSQLKALPLPVPPLALQQEFARRVAAVEQLRSAQRESLAKLDELFASLQHRAFRGEL